MKFYRKQPLEAEQFDGSEAMIEKYSIRLVTLYQIAAEPDEFEYVPFMIETLEAWVTIEVGDWIATDIKGEHWVIAADIFKQTYTKLPKVPGFVANHIGFSKHINHGFNSSILTMVQDIYDWYDKNGELYARAWLDGYKIEDKS